MTVVEQVLAPVVVTERERRARVLEAAALEIEVRGWGRGAASGQWWDGGAVCITGAILAVTETAPILGSCPDFSAAAQVWGNTQGYWLWHYNDDKGRTADDVTFVLRWRAIRDGR